MEQLDFEIRQVSLENLNRFSEMFRVCLGAEVDERYFEWKYKNNPAGTAVAFEAIHEGNVAGFYGVIPETYLVHGKRTHVYQSMDTMTHPNYQKRRLFTTLAKATYNHLIEKDGDTHIVGIPGSNSFHGLVHTLGWKNLHKFKYIFLHRLQHRLLNAFQSGRKWRFEVTNEVDAELSELLNAFIASDKGILPLIDPAVLKWKVLDHPIKKLEICKIYFDGGLVGYCVYSRDAKGYIKVELLKVRSFDGNKDVVSALSTYLFARHPGAAFVYSWRPLNAELLGLYQRAHYISNEYSRGPFSYRVPFTVYVHEKDARNTEWLDIGQYDLQPLMQD